MHAGHRGMLARRAKHLFDHVADALTAPGECVLVVPYNI